jgi:DNA-binding NtrC family response regulator
VAESILYIDDEAPNLVAFKYQFRHQFDIFTALSCKEACAYLDSGEVAVLLIDHRMPEISGGELSSLFGLAYPLVSRILVSAYLTKEEAERYLLDGAFSYVPKPWEYDELSTTLQSAMDHHETLKRVNGVQSSAVSIFKNMLHSRFRLDEAEATVLRTLELVKCR